MIGFECLQTEKHPRRCKENPLLLPLPPRNGSAISLQSRQAGLSAWLPSSIIPSMSASGLGVQAGDHVRSLDCRLRLCGCVEASTLQMKLHDMLVAGAASNTKGVRQNCPLISGSFLADQNSGPLPFSLRCAFGVFRS